MKFSLILPTYNRFIEITAFLDSLSNQSYKNFELIVVDQNQNNKIDNLCENYHYPITIIKSKTRVLSINRNIGLNHASGEIIAFPDDDCEYDPLTLEKILSFFNNNPDYNYYTCNTIDKYTQKSIFSGLSSNTEISKINFMRTGVSITIFTKEKAIKSFKFDEQLGIGAKFGSGEESDLLLYLLKNKNKGKYISNDYIYHPNTSITKERASSYGKGFGAVFKKGITVYHFYQLFPLYVLYLFKSLLNILVYKDKKCCIAILQGRISGFIQYKYPANA